MSYMRAEVTATVCTERRGSSVQHATTRAGCTTGGSITAHLGAPSRHISAGSSLF